MEEVQVIPSIVRDNRHEVVFCVKYKRKIFKDPRLIECAIEAFRQAEKEYGEADGVVNFVLGEITIEEAYVHLEISCDPHYGVHNAITKLKRTAAREMRKFDPSLDSRLPSIWTHNVYYKTIGTTSTEDEIQAYVESQ